MKTRLVADIIVTHDFMVMSGTQYLYREPKTVRKYGSLTTYKLTPSTHNPNVILKIAKVLHSDDHIVNGRKEFTNISTYINRKGKEVRKVIQANDQFDEEFDKMLEAGQEWRNPYNTATNVSFDFFYRAPEIE